MHWCGHDSGSWWKWGCQGTTCISWSICLSPLQATVADVAAGTKTQIPEATALPSRPHSSSPMVETTVAMSQQPMMRPTAELDTPMWSHSRVTVGITTL